MLGFIIDHVIINVGSVKAIKTFNGCNEDSLSNDININNLSFVHSASH